MPGESLTLDINKNYIFKRLNNSYSHPFYISNEGFGLPSNSNVSIVGDGSPTSGITGDQSFTLSFNDNFELGIFYILYSN